MANPKFEATDRITNYTWAELPHIPSDHAHLFTRLRQENSFLEYKRNDFIIGRTILAQIGIWKFQFKNISQSMINSLQTFFEESYFYYYPDADINSYFIVYVSDTAFRPVLQPNGTYNLVLTCREYGALGAQVSSSSSTSSSSSLSSSSSMSEDLITVAAIGTIYLHRGVSAQILTSFSAPDSDIRAVACISGNIYSGDFTSGKIYQHSGITSTIDSSFAAAVGLSGLGYDEDTGDLLSCNVSTDLVYIHSGISAAISTSWTAYNMTGVDWGVGIVVCCESSRIIYIHSGQEATILSTFAIPYYPRGLTIDVDQNAIICYAHGDSVGVRVHSGLTATLSSYFSLLPARTGCALVSRY